MLTPRLAASTAALAVTALLAAAALASCAPQQEGTPTPAASVSQSAFESLNYLPLAAPVDAGAVDVAPPNMGEAMSQVASAFTFRLTRQNDRLISVAVALDIDGEQVCGPTPYTVDLEGLTYIDVPACTATLTPGKHSFTYRVYWTDTGATGWLDTPNFTSDPATFTVAQFDVSNIRTFPPPPFA